MRKIFNFNPGPAMMPEAVLRRAQQEFLDWNGTGISPMELSHRSKEFSSIRDHIEKTVRDLLAIPNNYEILFLAGGATTQFAMIPMNLLHSNKHADYIITGIWSNKAALEAEQFGQISIAGAVKKEIPYQLPQQKELTLNPQAAYCYFTDNETIEGLEFNQVPETGEVPLICDMTSNIMSRPIDIRKFALIFASAQKNIGHAGITLIIIRKDLLKKKIHGIPSLFNYYNQAQQHSMLNTPPTYSWYFTGLMLDWIKQQGGLNEMARLREEKTNKIYQVIDASDFYINTIHPNSRSQMNVPFTLSNRALETTFLLEARKQGLVNLEGHRLVGGMRASVYVGMPMEGVEALASFMHDFEKKFG